jgi:hypothetical protein
MWLFLYSVLTVSLHQSHTACFVVELVDRSFSDGKFLRLFRETPNPLARSKQLAPRSHSPLANAHSAIPVDSSTSPCYIFLPFPLPLPLSVEFLRMAWKRQSNDDNGSDGGSDGNKEKKLKTRKPPNTAFRQQRLLAYAPILTPKTVLPLFFAVGIIFGPIGGLLLFASSQVLKHTTLEENVF